MSKRVKIIIAVVALIVIAAVAAFAFMGANGSGPEVEAATAKTQVLAVTVTASGKVQEGASADVYPPAPGTLDALYVEDGDTVKAGDKIAQLDPTALELQVAQARAGLAAAKAQLDNVGATGSSSSDVKAAASAVTAAKRAFSAALAARSAAQSGWDNAVAAHEGAKLMYSSSSPTATALYAARKQAWAGYLQAKAGVAQARAGVASARAQLRRGRAADPGSQRNAAEEGVRQAGQALAAAERTLDDATLVAPIDGVVLFNTPGSAVGAGAKPAEGSSVSQQSAPFTVVDLSALTFIAEVDEADIERVKTGMKVTVTLDSFPGEEFVTTVTRVNPAAQATATGGTVFEVEVALTDVGKDILLGMKGDADIEVSSRGAALTVPVEALFSEGGTDFVYVVDSGKLKKAEITVGATTDTEVEVLEGLTEGDVVALSGSTQYTDAMPVRVKQ